MGGKVASDQGGHADIEMLQGGLDGRAARGWEWRVGGGNGAAGGEEDEDVRLDRGLVTWIVPLGGKDEDCEDGHVGIIILILFHDGRGSRGLECLGSG